MAVKATDTITLAVAVDVQKVETYYYQTASTGSQPARPTTASPSGWQTTEFAFDSSKAIWSCQKTTLTDGAFFWGLVSKASAYQGSIEAWNKADAAQQTADAAAEAASNAAVTKSDSGKREIVTEDAAELPLLTLTAYGECQQDGTPTPDAPVPIKAVRGRNLFDLSVVAAMDSRVTVDGESFYVPLPSIVSGKHAFDNDGTAGQFTISYHVKTHDSSMAGGLRFTIEYDDGTIAYTDSNVHHDSETFISFTTSASKTLLNIRFFYNTQNPTTIRNLQIERGTVVSRYAPYGSIAAVARGKNRFNVVQFAGYTYTHNGITFTVMDDGGVKITGTATATADMQLFGAGQNRIYLPTGAYAFSASGVKSGMRIITSGGGGNGFPYTELHDGSTSATGNVTNDELPLNYLVFRVLNGYTVNTTAYAQIEPGTTATPYEPYRESVSYIDLNGEELCSLPDGTQDILTVDASGHVLIEKHVGSVVKAIADMSDSADYPGWTHSGIGDIVGLGVNANINSQVARSNIKSDGIIYGANTAGGGDSLFLTRAYFGLTGAEWKSQYPDLVVTIYAKYAEPRTIDLGYIDLPTTFDGGTVHVDAEIQPVIDASWWTKAGYETGKAYNDGNGSADLAALTERVTTNETAIERTNTQVALKANSSDVYTKTQTDGLISTEVTNRNAAIKASADAITSTVSENYAQIQSRGEQLVTNGAATLGDNTNFRSFVFDGSKANGSGGSFTRTPGATAPELNELIPVDQSQVYRVSFDAMSAEGDARLYCCLMCYDIDGNNIDSDKVLFVAGSLTTLTQDLKAGDTKIYLTDVSGFDPNGKDVNGVYSRKVIFWDYKNSFGYQYPEETYSRHLSPHNSWAAHSDIDYENNTITLRTAWTGDTVSAGTKLSQGNSGATYLYIAASYALIPTEWRTYHGYVGPEGVNVPSGVNVRFRAGTAKVRLGFLWNYQMTTAKPQSQIWITNVSMHLAVASSTEMGALESRMNTAESSITQQAGQIALKANASDVNTKQETAALLEVKADKATLTSEINASADTVKIDATRVNIEGAAIFTGSGRLSQDSLDSAYDENGAASAAQEAAVAAAAADAKAKAEAATAAANQNTENKLKSYSTTQQMNDAIGDAIDAIEVGGRNLLVSAESNGHLVSTTKMFEKAGWVISLWTSAWVNTHLTVGEDYILSYDATLVSVPTGYTASTETRQVPIMFAQDQSWVKRGPNDDGIYDNRAYTVGDKHHYELVFTFQTVTETQPYFGICMYTVLRRNSSNQSACDTFRIENLKLEKGNRATDWTPAPEDMAGTPDAVKRTQRIYWRSASSLSSWSMPTSWLTVGNDGSHQFGKWTTKVPRMTANADGTGTKYPFLYTCEQREMADGTLAYTTVLLDDSATIIDGGNIITGTVTANKLDAADINASNSFSIGALTVETAGDVLNSELSDQLTTLDGSLTALQDDIYGYENDQSEHVDGIIDELNADIEGLESGLAGKVDADAVIDAVNNSPEEAAVRISGARLDIDTNASFLGLTEIANAKIDTAQAIALFAQMLAAGRIRVGDIANIHIEQYPSRLSFLQANVSLEGYTDAQIAEQGSAPYDGEVAFETVDANRESLYYMNRSVVVNDLRFGDWKWYNRSNGHMTLQYVGTGV